MSCVPVTAVVVTYQSRELVGPAMEALRRAHEAGLLACTVVDNASSDGTQDFLARDHGWAELIASPDNLGYGRGLNLGLQSAETPLVLLMNPDAVIEPDVLVTLLQFMERHPAAGIVAPAIVGVDGSLQSAGALPTPWRLVARAAGLSRLTPEPRPIVPDEPPFQTDWLCGAILLARKEVMGKLGGFDPRFFLYFEETDLCRRATRAGAELWAVGEATARHVGGGSTRDTENELLGGCIAEHYFRSRFYYLAKHHGWLAAASTEIVELVLLAAKDLWSRLRRRPNGMLAARLRAPILRSPCKV